MRISKYRAVLDACVVAPTPVSDTLLRLAEEPVPRTAYQAESRLVHLKIGGAGSTHELDTAATNFAARPVTQTIDQT